MHPNQALITKFYEAFQRRDGAAMAACYHPDATFDDPVFPGLTGDEPGSMWGMLCEQGKDLRIEFSAVDADDAAGSARWEAWYTFSPTGRAVHNTVAARFTFRDGKIATHRDDFDLARWTRMALGPVGWALGWSPLIQAPLRRKAKANLGAWMRKRQSGG